MREAREHGAGPRNLAFGVGALFVALFIGSLSIFLVGPRAIVALTACLATFTVLYVLARLHVFRQRHGVFMAMGFVCLLGALFAMFERAFTGLDGGYLPLTMQSPIVQRPAASPAPSDPLPPVLTESFAISPPDSKSGSRVRALRDSRVVIDGKTFLIKAGDIFALAGTKDNEVTFKVRDLHIALPVTAVEILEAERKAVAAATPAPEPKPASEKPAAPVGPDPATVAATKGAQEEAVRRYPALGLEGSRENSVYVSTFRELKDSKAEDFFKNPEWPLELAELLAKREGWRRDDLPPAPVSAPQLAPPEVPLDALFPNPGN